MLTLLSEAEQVEQRRANGIPLHREGIEWFAQCTSERIAPLTTIIGGLA